MTEERKGRYELGNILSLMITFCCFIPVKSARKGADSTVAMKAKSGRASYTPKEQQTRVDPGAEAVAIWLGSVCSSLSAGL